MNVISFLPNHNQSRIHKQCQKTGPEKKNPLKSKCLFTLHFAQIQAKNALLEEKCMSGGLKTKPKKTPQWGPEVWKTTGGQRRKWKATPPSLHPPTEPVTIFPLYFLIGNICIWYKRHRWKHSKSEVFLMLFSPPTIPCSRTASCHQLLVSFPKKFCISKQVFVYCFIPHIQMVANYTPGLLVFTWQIWAHIPYPVSQTISSF